MSKLIPRHPFFFPRHEQIFSVNHSVGYVACECLFPHFMVNRNFKNDVL